MASFGATVAHLQCSQVGGASLPIRGSATVPRSVTKRAANPELKFRLERQDAIVAQSKDERTNMALLADVIRAWSDVIESVVARGRSPAAAEHKVVVKRIEPGSLRVFVEAPPTHMKAIALVSKSTRSKRDSLPPAARPYMKEFRSLLRKTQSKLQIVRNERAHVPEAMIVGDLPTKAAASISGITSFTGLLVEAGGKSPNIHLDLGSGKPPIIIACDKKLARELGSHLYSSVVVEVRAHWNAESLEVGDCTLLTWRPGPTKDWVTGIADLAKHHGDVWQDIDAKDWLRKFRGDEDE